MTRSAPPAPTPDDDLRELFAPLAADEPPPAELAHLRRRSAAAPGRRRLPRRPLAALAAATAAVAAGLALLPAASPPVPGPRPEPAAGVLRAAAAVAADQPVPRVTDAPYRYTRTRDRLTYEVRHDGAVARGAVEQPGERWVGVRWSGREAYGQGRSSISGDRELARRLTGLAQSFGPREGPVAYGDGPLAELDPTTLPATREAIAATLREGIRTDRWGPYPESRGRVTGPPGAERGGYAAYSFINLLVHARLSPPQRAALLDVLASDPAARDLGTVRDSEGREGRGIALEYTSDPYADPHHFSLVVDPATSEILEWRMASRLAGSPEGARDERGRPLVLGPVDRVQTVLATGYATALGERP